MKKLIRGVIYDNPESVEEIAYDTAEFLKGLSKSGSEYYDENTVNGKWPNKEEYITALTIFGIQRPSPTEENLIIPASLINDRLYQDLKKIDIGEDLLGSFYEVSDFNKKDVVPEDFCRGEEECLLRHVDKQDATRGRYFLDGREVSQEEMIKFMESEPELSNVVPFIKLINGEVSCF